MRHAAWICVFLLACRSRSSPDAAVPGPVPAPVPGSAPSSCLPAHCNLGTDPGIADALRALHRPAEGPAIGCIRRPAVLPRVVVAGCDPATTTVFVDCCAYAR